MDSQSSALQFPPIDIGEFLALDGDRLLKKRHRDQDCQAPGRPSRCGKTKKIERVEDSKWKGERSMGRWRVEQHFQYILAVHECNTLEEVISRLRVTVPHRDPSQIKAHHQKMAKKHGSWQAIRSSYSQLQHDQDLLIVVLRLEAALRRLTDLNNSIQSLNRVQLPPMESE